MIPSPKTSLSQTPLTLLITGASCKMGNNLIRRLSIFPDLNIRAMVNRSLVDAPGCEIRPGSLNNLELMARALSGVDIVVHLAALTKSKNESDYFETNVKGTKNLVDVCLEQGVKKIIYVSSQAASLNGGAYSLSKLEAEQYIKKSKIQWVILRPSEVYGQEGDSINQLIWWVQNFVCVPVIGQGKSKLSPVYIDDVIKAMVASIFIEEIENKTLILAGPEELTYDELVDRIAAYFGVSRFKVHLPAGLVKLIIMIFSKLGMSYLVPDQVPRLLCEKLYGIDLAKEKLDYSPRYLEDGMEKFFLSGVN